MSRSDIRARLEGIGETALAAQEDVDAQIRQLGAPTLKGTGRWQVTERYFTTVRATPALILFECDASLEWVPDITADETEPF